MSKCKKILGITLLVLLLVATTLLATSCGGSAKKPGKVSAESITYDGGEIKWAAAENARSYKVEVNGNEMKTEITSIAYSSKDADTVTVKITPLGKKDKAGETTEMTFTRLGKDEELVITFNSEGVASWNAITGASAYIVEVNGKSQKITSLSFSDFERGRINTIRVKPSSTDNSTFADWSKSVSKTFLAVPSNIDFDGSRISWKGSSEASGYEIYINGVLLQSVGKVNSYSYDAEGKSFDLTMRAVGDDEEVFSSPESDEARFVYLSPVDEIRVENGTIIWDAVDEASSYDVKLNNKVTNVTQPKVEKIKSGIDNIISICPKGDPKDGAKYFSSWSEEQKVHIIAAPEVNWNSSYALDGTPMASFEWEPVTGVDHYEVLLVHPTGQEENIVASSTVDVFSYAYLEHGEYKVSVKAVPVTGDGYYESSYSEAITVIRLAPPSPATSGIVTSNALSSVPEFTIHLKDQSAAVGFTVYHEGNVIINRANSTNIKVSNILNDRITTAQQFTYSVQAIGEGLDTSSGEMVVTLSSLSSENYAFDITVLATPQNLDPEGKMLNWDAVPNALGYKVIGFDAQTSQNNYDLSGIKTPGDYSLQVFAMGDNRNVLSSPPSETLKVRKLAAPIDVHVEATGESEGKLQIDEVIGAKSYGVSINGSEEYIDSVNLDNINTYVNEGGVSIRVKAVADAYDDANAIYCLTSEPSERLSLVKLKAPTWGQTIHNETHLLWIGATNITAATPGYLVCNGQGIAYDGQYNATQFSLEDFAPGTYTFTIRAIGDGRTTLTSDTSTPVTLTKLASPVVSITPDKTSYMWESVGDAQRYVVYIDGKLVDTINSATGNAFYKYTPKQSDFNNQQGTHNVTVTAVSDQHVDSSPYLIEQVVEELGMPSFNMTYSETSYTPNGKITVTATANTNYTDNTHGFVFQIGGATFDTQTENVYLYNPDNTGTYTATVTAIGGMFDMGGNGKFYINSRAAASKNITLLGTVAKNSISLSGSGTLSWNPVTGATGGYEIVVLDESGNEMFAAPITERNPSHKFDLYDAEFAPERPFKMDNAHLYTFIIRAIGNGSSVINSDTVTWTTADQ